jgi:hypothetical protein
MNDTMQIEQSEEVLFGSDPPDQELVNNLQHQKSIRASANMRVFSIVIRRA